MKLGILVNTARHPEHAAGIAKAAVSKGHEVIIFIMDEGVRLLTDPGFSSLCGLKGVQMGFCKHSTKIAGVATECVPEGISEGSQLYNVMMHHDADKVIVL